MFSLLFSPILLAINEVPPTVTTTEAAINCLKKNNFQNTNLNSINDSIKKAKTLSSKKVR